MFKNWKPSPREHMSSHKLAYMVVGLILLLMGTVFALQGANVITGSSLMSGNSTYIYVGAVVAIIGLILLAWSFRTGKAAASPMPLGQAQPAPQ
jgi:protein-S-isoprenylcysteine O-methyltransferase Ste14